MSSQEDSDVVARFSTSHGRPITKRTSEKDRHEFIDWMFDHMKDFDLSLSRTKLSKEISSKYKEETGLSIGINWISFLLKYGICKLRDGSYKFEENVNFTVDDVCKNPNQYMTLK